MYHVKHTGDLLGINWSTSLSLSLSLSLQPLTVTQIKKAQSLMDEANSKCTVEMKECETERHRHLVMIGNVLHPSVPVSNDEVGHVTVTWLQCIFS